MRRVDKLIEIVRRQTDNEDVSATQGLADDELVQYLNDAQERLQSLISAKYPNAFVKEVEIDAVYNQAAYTIPDKVYLDNRIVNVEYSITGQPTDYYDLHQITLREYNTRRPGNPWGYTRRDNQIFLRPPPQGNNAKIRVKYERKLRCLDKRRGRIFSMTGALAETFTIQCNETTGAFHRWRISVLSTAAAIVENTWFAFDSPHSSFYVWFNKGTGTDPGPSTPALAGKIGIEADISAAVSANDVENVIVAAVDAISDFRSNSVGVALFDIFIELDFTGSALDEGTADAHINVTVTTQGSGQPFLARWQAGQYFTIDSPTNGYYVWPNVDGRSTDPAPAGRVGIEVTLAGDSDAAACATAIAAAIDAEADFTATSATDTVTVTCTEAGVAGNPDKGTMSEASTESVNPALTITVTQQGTQVDIVNLEDTLPPPDGELDNLQAGDYVSIVDKDGVVKADCIPANSGSSTIGAALVDVEYSLEAGEAPRKGDYVVFGCDCTTHSELPDICERYLILYAMWRILRRDEAGEAQSVKGEMAAVERDIVASFADMDHDFIPIPVEDYEII